MALCPCCTCVQLSEAPPQASQRSSRGHHSEHSSSRSGHHSSSRSGHHSSHRDRTGGSTLNISISSGSLGGPQEVSYDETHTLHQEDPNQFLNVTYNLAQNQGGVLNRTYDVEERSGSVDNSRNSRSFRSPGGSSRGASPEQEHAELSGRGPIAASTPESHSSSRSGHHSSSRSGHHSSSRSGHHSSHRDRTGGSTLNISISSGSLGGPQEVSYDETHTLHQEDPNQFLNVTYNLAQNQGGVLNRTYDVEERSGSVDNSRNSRRSPGGSSRGGSPEQEHAELSGRGPIAASTPESHSSSRSGHHSSSTSGHHSSHRERTGGSTLNISMSSGSLGGPQEVSYDETYTLHQEDPNQFLNVTYNLSQNQGGVLNRTYDVERSGSVDNSRNSRRSPGGSSRGGSPGQGHELSGREPMAASTPESPQHEVIDIIPGQEQNLSRTFSPDRPVNLTFNVLSDDQSHSHRSSRHSGSRHGSRSDPQEVSYDETYTLHSGENQRLNVTYDVPQDQERLDRTYDIDRESDHDNSRSLSRSLEGHSREAQNETIVITPGREQHLNRTFNVDRPINLTFMVEPEERHHHHQSHGSSSGHSFRSGGPSSSAHSQSDHDRSRVQNETIDIIPGREQHLNRTYTVDRPLNLTFNILPEDQSSVNNEQAMISYSLSD